MYGSQLTLLATALVAAGVAMSQNTFSVATPSSLVTCQPYRITWTGGVAPFFPIITQPMQVGQLIKTFPQTNEQSVLWTVDLAAGTTVTLAVGDSAGTTAASAVSPPIVAGSVTSCPASNPGASTGTAASSTGSASSSASSSSTTTATTAATSSTSASRPATTASSSTTSARPATSVPASPNAAGSLRSSAAVVAVFVGAVAVALV